MEVFSDILQLDCIYQFEGDIKENYNWNGILLLEFSPYLSKKRSRKIFNLKGLNVDKSDSQDEEKIHKRFILGVGGLYKSDNSIKFSIFPGNIAPIDYVFKYDEEDCCLYGAWYNANEYHKIGGYAKASFCFLEDYNQEKIEKEIDNWCMSEYYMQYKDLISRLEDEELAHSGMHIYDRMTLFRDSKYYFKEIENEKVLKLEKYNI